MSGNIPPPPEKGPQEKIPPNKNPGKTTPTKNASPNKITLEKCLLGELPPPRKTPSAKKFKVE